MTSAAVAPEWYRRLNARALPRRSAVPGRVDEAEMLAVRKMRAMLEADLDALMEKRARVSPPCKGEEEESWPARDLGDLIQFRLTVLERLTNESLEASKTGKFDRARTASELLKKVNLRIMDMSKAMLDPYMEVSMGRCALLASQICTLTAISNVM